MPLSSCATLSDFTPPRPLHLAPREEDPAVDVPPPRVADDEAALCRRHLRFAYGIARNVHAQLDANVALDLLLSAARVGLFDAARRFDPTRGIGFEAFASPRVLGAIVDELRDEYVLQRQTTERPLELRALLDAVVRSSAPLELHEEASLAWIAAWRSVYGVRALSVEGSVSMSGAVDDDALRADESIERTERFAALERAIAGLEPRKRVLVEYLFANDVTMAKLAAAHGRSTSWTWRLVNEAFADIRRAMLRASQCFRRTAT